MLDARIKYSNKELIDDSVKICFITPFEQIVTNLEAYFQDWIRNALLASRSQEMKWLINWGRIIVKEKGRMRGIALEAQKVARLSANCN